ncbi:phosphomannomutase/phosphoglucomutase [Carboxydothermus ferrireducens]|uniref:Phosphomannomutase/phosphoglucomutase n=1 Tax=Carboxydothermus ferrireducens DSM 11255 TaxID=1119529 RepID=A0ABX2R7S2_9THEO|nr:phosphomannomutase/phosphoglucomutase [Carboxydothermus ferrireducens]NYE56945.1 phosphomannomutase/phosphoglucomutase [Carboxydothermus ferrireducens DSM 11255]
MHIIPSIFREYDIRGIAETELTNEVVEKIGQAYGTFLKNQGITRATVGGDVRLSTPRIKDYITKGLMAVGIDVIDIGIVTTPLFYYSLYHFDVNGGVMVTGSHNPKEFNGLKLALGKTTIYGEQIQEIRKIIEENRIALSEKPGKVTQENIGQAYIEMLTSKIKLGPKKLKVVADAGNGAASDYIVPYLEALGCEVIPLYCQPDGNFPNHHPDPVKRENLVDLINHVREEKADLGIAFDGDADRIGVVDDKGEVVWGDKLMILYWREILARYPGETAIVEVKCSQALVDEIIKLGGKPYFYKTGHSLIKAKMKELNALFTGEMSGHMFFADEYYGFDDAFYAAGRLLRILSNTDKKLSELLADVPVYYSTAETRIDCPDDLKFKVIEKIKEEALKQYYAITVDGIRILYPDGWGLVRASNTQPVLVARCEAKSPERLKEITTDLKQRIINAGLEDFEWEY